MLCMIGGYKNMKLTRINMQDPELKCLGENIVHKNVALEKAEGSDKILFDLEISTLQDKFEARCMILLATAIALKDPLVVKQHIEMIQKASSESMQPELFINLYRNLIRHVLFELKGAAQMEVLEKLEVFL